MGFNSIAPWAVEDYIDNRHYMIIDVRDYAAYRQGHIRRAVHIPYEEFDYYKEILPRDKTLILYCDRGSTGLLLARELYNQGFDVLNITGGIHAYRGPLYG